MAHNNSRIVQLRRGMEFCHDELISYENFLNRETTVSDYFDQVENRTGDVRVNLRPKYDKLYEELDSLLSDEDSKILAQEKNSFMDTFFAATSKADGLLRNFKRLEQGGGSSTSTVQESNGTSHNNMDSPASPNKDIKIPIDNLPQFDNRYESWEAFVEDFKFIKNDKKLTDNEKMYYLKLCLTGRALSKIQSLKNNTENVFSNAWKILEKNFYDPSDPVIKHIKAICDIPVMTEVTDETISNLYNQISEHYGALESMKQQFLAMWPIYIITSKFDTDTAKKWKAQNIGKKLPTMKKLLDFLQNYQNELDLLSNSTESQSHPEINNRKSNHNNKRSSPSTSSNNNSNNKRCRSQNNLECHLCYGSHDTDCCEGLLVSTLSERFEMITGAKLCVNCFKPNHEVKNCKSTPSCNKCDEKHHPLLHRDPESLPTPSTATEATNISRTQIDPEVIDIIDSIPDCNLQYSIELSIEISSEYLLPTAIIDIPDVNHIPQACRILLVPHGQCNFITEKFAQKLGFTLDKSLLLNARINQVSTPIKSSVLPTIISKYDRSEWCDEFQVIEKITDRLPLATINRANLVIPKYIQLADPHFHQPGAIDAVLGCQMFHKLRCDEEFSIHNSALIIQKTYLGWVVSGLLNDRASSMQQ